MQVNIREGKREGYSDIEFSAKPDSDTRTRLKQNGFRWSPRYQVWYGLTERIGNLNLDGATVEESAPKAAASNGNGDGVTIPASLAARIAENPEQASEILLDFLKQNAAGEKQETPKQTRRAPRQRKQTDHGSNIINL